MKPDNVTSRGSDNCMEICLQLTSRVFSLQADNKINVLLILYYRLLTMEHDWTHGIVVPIYLFPKSASISGHWSSNLQTVAFISISVVPASHQTTWNLKYGYEILNSCITWVLHSSFSIGPVDLFNVRWLCVWSLPWDTLSLCFLILICRIGQPEWSES